jgi:alkaline phosphatase
MKTTAQPPVAATNLARWLLLLLAAVCLLEPAAARRTRTRRRAAPRPQAARSQAARSQAARAVVPVADPVRNVILFIANDYREGQWREARAAQPDGYLAMDRMPVTGAALPPSGHDEYDAANLAALLATGQDGARYVPLLGLAKQYGRGVALVAGHAVTDPLPAGFAVSDTNEDDASILRRLATVRVDVLYGRSGRDFAELLSSAGYRVATDAQSLLMEETAPAAAVTPAENVPFDTLVFRALHLVAKNPRGLMMAVTASPSSVSAAEFNAALTTALSFARRDTRTLVLVASRHGDASLDLYASGKGSEKFAGTIATTDVPKIVAGLTGLKIFRRDFSPLFANRTQKAPAPLPVKTGTRGMQALPW